MTLDRTNGISLLLAAGLHAGLGMLMGYVVLQTKPSAETPMLIEVTLAGTSAPYSRTEGVKARAETVAARQEEGETEGGEAAQPVDPAAWRAQKRQEIIERLAASRREYRIGEQPGRLRQAEGLAEGRGAGVAGQPGSLAGSDLTLSGELASRGYRSPDFDVLKKSITEATQLRILLRVQPGGEVKEANLLETSGYPFLDQEAIALAREIVFDPLPHTWKQVDQQGVLTIRLVF